MTADLGSLPGLVYPLPSDREIARFDTPHGPLAIGTSHHPAGLHMLLRRPGRDTTLVHPRDGAALTHAVADAWARCAEGPDRDLALRVLNLLDASTQEKGVTPYPPAS